MPNETVTPEEEVAQVGVRRPHVVILGAGASKAVCPRGDREGRIVPVMDELCDVVDLTDLKLPNGDALSKNFEDAYSLLAESGDTATMAKVEERVERYFADLALPDDPTIYDDLVLSLRETDLIATFNWDPLLLHAYSRCGKSGLRLPQLAILHGNVDIGFCATDTVLGLAGRTCPHCGVPYAKVPLLFPVRNKDYATDPAIARQWAVFQSSLTNAFMVTIFGYRGPRTDAAAVDAMKEAWGRPESREMEQLAFIVRDKNAEDAVLENWGDFVHSHHYELCDDFYDSWIANHPRRTGEAWVNQYLEAKFIDSNPIPRTGSVPDRHAWFQRFKEPEDEAASRGPDD